MENVRTATPPQTTKDLDTVTEGGVVYVLPNTGGISTFSSSTSVPVPVWKIPKGTTYPDTLKVWNDKPANGHWTWAPFSKMKMSDYQATLAAINAKAVKQ
jgi:hypothetical protein